MAVRKTVILSYIYIFRYGRKIVVYLSLLAMIGSSLGLPWADSYVVFVVLQFILGAAIVASFMAAYIICRFKPANS